MRVISESIAGRAGLGPALLFLVAGAVAIGFAASAGLYLASSGAPAISATLLLVCPLLAGVVHAIVSAIAVRRGAATSGPATRAIVLLIAAIYLLLQLAALAAAVVLVIAFTH
jgi:hypothetical protein